MPLVLPHVAVAHELVDSARLGAALVVHPSGEAGPGLEEGCGAQSLSEWQLNRGRPILLWGRGLLGLEVRVVLAVAHELEGVGEAAAAVGAGAAGVGAAVPLRGGRGQAHLEAGARHQRHDSHLQVHAHAAAARVPAVPRAAHLAGRQGGGGGRRAAPGPPGVARVSGHGYTATAQPPPSARFARPRRLRRRWTRSPPRHSPPRRLSASPPHWSPWSPSWW